MPILNQTTLDGVTLLRLEGGLGQLEIQQVERSFRQAAHQAGAAVVVELSQVDFIATAAIAMFLEAAKILKESSGKIVISGPQPRVADVLRRLRLERVLPVYSTVDEGIAAVKK
jgi:anti-sigma B factor antagonist